MVITIIDNPLKTVSNSAKVLTVNSTCNSDGLPRSPIFQWWNQDDFHRLRCPEEIHHFLVAEIYRCHFADLHQATSLQQAHLISKTVLLHIRHNGICIDVEP